MEQIEQETAYSNFITPPDFVDDDFPTVTIVDAIPDDIEMLGRMAKEHHESFNFYLYHQGMNDKDWLNEAIARSTAVIVNTNDFDNEELCVKDNVYYYGPKVYVSEANKVHTLFDYFALRVPNITK